MRNYCYQVSVQEQEEESLSSFFLRTCKDLLITPLDLRKETQLETRTDSSVHYRDLDWPNDVDLTSFGRPLHKSPTKLYNMSLLRYANLLTKHPSSIQDPFCTYNRELSFWFIHPNTKFCPHCLENESYFRVNWKVRPSSVCHRHRAVLLDNCVCSKPVNLFNLTKSYSVKDLDRKIITCQYCGKDFRSLKTHYVEDSLLNSDLILSNLINGVSHKEQNV